MLHHKILLLLVLFFPHFTAMAAPSATFRVRLLEDLGTLDWNYGEVNSEVIYQLMEGLFRAGKNGKPQPAAAKAFHWNKEKTEIIIQLRRDRVWSDGAPLCAQQFVDSWTRLRSKEFASPFAHYAAVVKSFAAKGCKELRVSFHRPAPEATALFANYVFFPLRLDNLAHSPRAFNEGSSLLVNGAFRVKEWKRNTLLVLEQNFRFGGPKPFLQRIEFRFVPDDSTAKTMFDLKEIDWMKEVPKLMRSPALENSAEFRVFPSLIVYYFGLNATHSKLLADQGIRQLLSDSLDRSEIPKVLGKECRGTSSWLVPELMPNLPVAKHVPDPKAKDRLTAAVQAGEMNLLLRVYSKPAHKLLAEWAQGQWEKKLGIRIPIEVQEGKVYWKEISVNPSPLFFGGVTAPFGHPRAFMQEFLSSGTANWTGWHSGKYDSAVESGDFADAEAILEKDGYVIPLYQRDTVALVQSGWKNFHINPLGQVFLSVVR